MEKFRAIAVFLKVVEAKSFAKASDLLDLTPSAVSKSISGLERELGVQLLVRSTRSLRLTDAGGIFYDRCRQIFADYEELEMNLRGTDVEPKGRLRVDMPVVIARSLVFPSLPSFLERYPNIQIELGANDRQIDLIQEGYDAVIRWGELKDSRLIARYLFRVQWVTCASPEYLSKYGTPQTPQDLQHHNCVNYFFAPSGQPFTWQFNQNGKVQSFSVQGNFLANNPDILLDATLSGMGLYQTAHFAVASELALGRLQTVLSDYDTSGATVWLVYPQYRYLSAKVRVFAEFMIELTSKLRS